MMKYLILKVQDKLEFKKGVNYCEIVYESKFMNTIGIEIEEEYIELLRNNSNIISFRESRNGEYQPQLLGNYC